MSIFDHEDKITKENGERVIMTFGGEKPFEITVTQIALLPIQSAEILGDGEKGGSVNGQHQAQLLQIRKLVKHSVGSAFPCKQCGEELLIFFLYRHVGGFIAVHGKEHQQLTQVQQIPPTVGAVFF